MMDVEIVIPRFGHYVNFALFLVAWFSHIVQPIEKAPSTPLEPATSGLARR